MDVTYAIVKVYLTDRNSVIKCHKNISAIWRTFTIEVSALLKLNVQKWKLSWVLGVDRNVCPSGSQSSITQQTSWCQSDPQDGLFYLSLTPLTYSYILTYQSFKKCSIFRRYKEFIMVYNTKVLVARTSFKWIVHYNLLIIPHLTTLSCKYCDSGVFLWKVNSINSVLFLQQPSLGMNKTC